VLSIVIFISNSIYSVQKITKYELNKQARHKLGNHESIFVYFVVYNCLPVVIKNYSPT